jgi:RHS repeat-associated protein
MQIPSKVYSASSLNYRYGFNGKENDSEVKGDGNQYDYGFRIYDPRVGRFLSVDPLIKKYPELTTYQFASNRPIDGVDLDGLEYVKRVHTVDAKGNVIATENTIYYTMDEQTLLAHGGTPANWYNAAGYGPEGKGIKHEYYLQNGEKSEMADVWELQQNSLIGSLSSHGLYSGDGAITYTGKKDYDFSWKPIDASDAIARRHDINYRKVGAFDVVEDTRTLSADKQMVDETQKYLYSSPFRMLLGERIAGETMVSLMSQNKFIGILADYKEWKAGYMLKNGLDPTSPEHNKKVTLDNINVMLDYINSDGNRKEERMFNLSILRITKSQTRDDKKKK